MKKANGLTRGMATLALCLIATVPAACAASSSGGADPQGFTLTDGFLAKYQAAELDIAKDPCRLGFAKFMGMGMGGANGGGMSLEQAAARYDAQPGTAQHAFHPPRPRAPHDRLPQRRAASRLWRREW